MKKQMILGAVLAMLCASGASAEGLSPSAKRGAGDAKLITELVLLLRSSPSGMRKSFGPCEPIVQGVELCGRLFYGYQGDTVTRVWVGVFGGKGKNEVVLGEYIAAAAFRFNKELEINFQDLGEDESGWHKLVWDAGPMLFSVEMNKKGGVGRVGVGLR